MADRAGPTALLINDRRAAAVEVATSWVSRLRGLLGRDGIDGALWLKPARSVHTIGMRFPIDVAYVDGGGSVVATTSMRPHRLGRLGASWRSVLEAERGSFERWGLEVGDVVSVEPEAGQGRLAS